MTSRRLFTTTCFVQTRTEPEIGAKRLAEVNAQYGTIEDMEQRANQIILLRSYTVDTIHNIRSPFSNVLCLVLQTSLARGHTRA